MPMTQSVKSQFQRRMLFMASIQELPVWVVYKGWHMVAVMKPQPIS